MKYFIQKLDASGNFYEAKSFGVTADYGLSICRGCSGNVYTTGYFQGWQISIRGAGTANHSSWEMIFSLQKTEHFRYFVLGKIFWNSILIRGNSICGCVKQSYIQLEALSGTVNFDGSRS